MKKPDEGKRDQNKRRGNKRLRTSPRLSKELISSSIHSINNNDYGRLVWGKIPGSRTWPGIIINHVTCGMDPPSEKSVWIFWFGDNRISLGVISKTYDFVSNFAKFFSLRNAPATFRRGILDMLIECRRRAGLHLARNESELGSLVKWAEGEFQNPSKSLSVFMPYEEIQLPEKVLKQIERIKSAQAQSGDNGGLRAGELDQFPTSSSSSESDSDTEERRIWRSKAVLLKQARVGKACLDSFCIGCEKGEEEGMVVPHPLFQGGLCGSCKVEFDGCFGSSGMDGINFFCAVCSSPGEVLVCDNEQCDRVFCVGCIELYVAPSAVDKIKSTDPWLCFLCSDYNPKSHGLLVPRPEWINEGLRERTECFAETGLLPPLRPKHYPPFFPRNRRGNPSSANRRIQRP